MFTVKKRLGGFAASYNGGSEFVDPCPFRAIELAANAEHDRLWNRFVVASRQLRELRRGLDETEPDDLPAVGFTLGGRAAGFIEAKGAPA